MVTPTQELIDGYVESFLIGKKVGFTIDDLETLARNAQAAQQEEMRRGR